MMEIRCLRMMIGKNVTDMRKKVIILFLGLLVLMAGCKSKDVPGRRRTPKHCNTCTKWSYIPVKSIDYEA